MNEKYKKIINLPYQKSTKHTPMAKGDRAAQFAPYSALSGYEDAVEETARLTDSKIKLDDYEKERINQTLTTLLSSPPGTKATITYFRPDNRKPGGAYLTITDEIHVFDEIKREITLGCGKIIQIDDIAEIIIKI